MNNKIKEKFEEIYRGKKWGSGYDGVKSDYFSGLGSSLKHIKSTESYIKNFCEKFDKKPNISDLGCGAFEVGEKIRKYFNSYNAYDVVPDLIERNKTQYKDLDVNFYFADVCEDFIEDGELGLIRYVIQHLNNESVSKLIKNIQDKFDYIIVIQDIYSSEDGIIPPFNSGDVTLGKTRCLHHPVRLDKPPFNLQCIQYTEKIENIEGKYLESDIFSYQYRIFQTYKLK